VLLWISTELSLSIYAVVYRASRVLTFRKTHPRLKVSEMTYEILGSELKCWSDALTG